MTSGRRPRFLRKARQDFTVWTTSARVRHRRSSRPRGYANASASRSGDRINASFASVMCAYQWSTGIRTVPGDAEGLNGSLRYPTRSPAASIRPTQVVPERGMPVTRIGRWTSVISPYPVKVEADAAPTDLAPPGGSPRR
ncbi:MAG TPA: hypothetical protein VFU40_10115 [Gemmatimonadales bacterium]|nr:hypothetical protein [Gemmatimonadales bacterium]